MFEWRISIPLLYEEHPSVIHLPFPPTAELRIGNEETAELVVEWFRWNLSEQVFEVQCKAYGGRRNIQAMLAEQVAREWSQPDNTQGTTRLVDGDFPTLDDKDVPF